MRKLLSVGLLSALATSAFAGSVLNETFDYVDDAALDAVWNASGDNDSYVLDPNFGNPLPSYMLSSPPGNFAGRQAINLGGDFNGTDANPLVMSFDFYLQDDGLGQNWNGARHYVELRGYSGDAFGSGDLENLLAMGAFNNSDDGFDGTKYQGRVTFGSNWNSLDDEAGGIDRTTGWQNLSMMITGSEIRYRINGVLAEVEARPNGFGFDSIVLGSDLTAAGWTAWVDNLSVEIVPEPTSLSLLALGCVALIRRR